MTLPASGQLSLSAIATEIYGSVGTNRSLDTMGVAASITRPVYVSDFYGYTHVLDVPINWSGTITSVSTRDKYQTITHTGQPSTSTIKITVLCESTYMPSDLTTVRYYYSVNSTTAWTEVGFRGSGNKYTAIYITIPSTGGFAYNDTIRFRVTANAAHNGNIWIDSALVVSGTNLTFTPDIFDWEIIFT